MNTTKMKALAVNTAMALVMGVGATALFLPSVEDAVVKHRTDEKLAHIRQSLTHDPVSTARPAKQGAGDTVGNLRRGGTTATVSPNKHGGTQPTVSPNRHGGTQPTINPNRHGGTQPSVSPNKHGGTDAVGHG